MCLYQKVAGTVARSTVDMHWSNETIACTINSSFFGLRVQSDEVIDPFGGDVEAALTADTLTSQNVTFTDNATGEEFTSPKVADGVALVDGTEDLQLGNFFARPTLIHTYAWTTATTGVKLATFSPWSLLLSSTAIKPSIPSAFTLPLDTTTPDLEAIRWPLSVFRLIISDPTNDPIDGNRVTSLIRVAKSLAISVTFSLMERFVLAYLY